MAAERNVDTGTEQLLCSIRHGVATLTLNRPEARNALSAELTPALERTIADCDADDTVRALLITGAGTAFCAGGDVKSMGDRRAGDGPEPGRALPDHAATASGHRRRALCAAQADGGGPSRPGGGGGTRHRARVRHQGGVGVGLRQHGLCRRRPERRLRHRLAAFARGRPSRARELLLTNERVPAARAAELGIVHRVVADEALPEEAFALARSLAEGPSIAFRYIKDNLDEAMEITYRNGHRPRGRADASGAGNGGSQGGGAGVRREAKADLPRQVEGCYPVSALAFLLAQMLRGSRLPMR